MTRGIYRLVVGGMAVIALLAVIRSFAGGNEVAATRLGWGALSFTYPGMWDLLGIIGSVLWVNTRPGIEVRRWGIGITLVAVAVVAFSLGSEAYVTARDTLPGGWPEAAALASGAVSVIYAVLTHVASKCRIALRLQEAEEALEREHALTDPQEDPWKLSLAAGGDASLEEDQLPIPTEWPSTPPTEKPSPADLGTAPSEIALPPASSTPASAPSAATTSSEPSPPPAGAPTSASASTSTATSPPREAAGSTVAARTPTSSSGRTTLPGTFFGSPTTPASTISSSPTTTATLPSRTETPDDAPTEPNELVPDRTDPNGDPDLPATYAADGQAPPKVRRRWIRDKQSLGLEVKGADVDRRFGAPRTGARLLRDVQTEQPQAVR